MVTRGIRRTLDQKFSKVLVNVEHLDPEYKLFILKIHSAAGLAKKDIFGLSDPYVKVRIKSESQDHVMALSPETTRTVKKTLSPIWNERVCYLISEKQFTVFLDVYDENIITKDEHLGRATIHFHFENRLTDDFIIHPNIWKTDGWQEEYATKSCLSLMEKYNDSIQKELCVLTEHDHLLYTKNILSEFQDKCRVNHQRGVKGAVNISYAFLDPCLPEAIVIMKRDCHINVMGRPVCRPRLLYSEDSTKTESARSLELKPPKLVSNNSVPDFGKQSSDASLDNTRRVDSNGRMVFVYHETCSTSLQHPSIKCFNPRNYLPRHGPSEEADTNNMAAGEGSIQTSKDYIPVKQIQELPIGWEARMTIGGRMYNVDHNSRTTHHMNESIEEPTSASSINYSRDYRQKYDNLHETLKPTHQIPSVLKLVVRSEHVAEDSYKCIMEVDDKEDLKNRLEIISVTGDNTRIEQDTSDWFQLLSNELFTTYYGLFEHAASDDYTLQINPDSENHLNNHLDYFRFIGRILGIAIYNKILIDAFFIRPFYKMLLHQVVDIKDMESVNTKLHNTIEYIQDNDPEPLNLSFALNETVFGEVCEEELKPGGRRILVTESNKGEYISLLMKWRFTQRIHKQMSALRNGVSDIIPLCLLQIFDARELEYLLGGLAHIDVNDWQKNTELRGYLPTDPVIVWFWKAVENYDDEMRARLLQFVTGTSKVFAGLKGGDCLYKLCIRKKGQTRDLPRTHTWFNRIDLPPYTSHSQLEEKLTIAIENVKK